MFRTGELILLFVFASVLGAQCCTPAVAYDYYVDPAGSDSNNGTSTATPFATCSKAQSVVTTGQSVGMKAGGVWRELCSVTADNVTIGMYGYGAMPVITGAASISAGSWSLVGGTTHCYQATGVAIDTSGPVNFVNVYEQGTAAALQRVTSSALCDSTAGSAFPSSDTTTPITLMIHPTAGGNPATSGIAYEYTARATSIEGGNGTVVRDIHTSRNLSGRGSIHLSKPYSMVIGCLVEDGNEHSLLIGTGGRVINTTIQNSYCAGCANIVLVFNADTPAKEGVTFEGVRITQPASSGIVPGTQAVSGHPNIYGTFGLVSYLNSYAEKSLGGFSGGAADQTFYNGDTLNTVGTGISAFGPTWVYNTSILNLTGTNAAGISDSGNSGSPVVIRNTTITDDGGGRYSIYGNASASGLIVDVQNSTLSAGIGAFLSGSGDTFTSLNNTICFYVNQNAGPFTLNSDFNNFTGCGGGMTIQNVSYGSLAAYKAATGQDLHSTP